VRNGREWASSHHDDTPRAEWLPSPKSPFQFQRHQLTPKNLQTLWEIPPPPTAAPHEFPPVFGPSVSKLHLHGATQILEAGRFGGRIMEKHHRRMGHGIYLKFHPRRTAWSDCRGLRWRSAPTPAGNRSRTRSMHASSSSCIRSVRLFRLPACSTDSSLMPRNAGLTDKSMSSENRLITPKTFDSDVPP